MWNYKSGNSSTLVMCRKDLSPIQDKVNSKNKWLFIGARFWLTNLQCFTVPNLVLSKKLPLKIKSYISTSLVSARAICEVPFLHSTVEIACTMFQSGLSSHICIWKGIFCSKETKWSWKLKPYLFKTFSRLFLVLYYLWMHF